MSSKNRDIDSTDKETELEHIRVSKDDVIEILRRSHRYRNDTIRHSLRINPPLDREGTAKPHNYQRGNYYPPEMTPKPIHISASKFVPDGTPLRPPLESVDQDLFEDEWQNIDKDNKKAAWDEWRETTVETWKNTLKRAMDEVETVEVRGSELDVVFDK